MFSLFTHQGGFGGGDSHSLPSVSTTILAPSQYLDTRAVLSEYAMGPSPSTLDLHHSHYHHHLPSSLERGEKSIRCILGCTSLPLSPTTYSDGVLVISHELSLSTLHLGHHHQHCLHPHHHHIYTVIPLTYLTYIR